MMERRRRFLLRVLSNREPAKLVCTSRPKWILTLYHKARSFSAMQTPCSDYRETNGLIYFARMLDKIRLHAEGLLAPGYFVGVEDPTFVDARCTRFLCITYDELVDRTLKGGSYEEVLEWCFWRGRRPSDEEVEI